MRRRRAKRYGRARTNGEGLTLGQWILAANAFGKVIEGSAAMHAWREGEDPTEYAALASRGMKVKLEGGQLVARKG